MSTRRLLALALAVAAAGGALAVVVATGTIGGGSSPTRVQNTTPNATSSGTPSATTTVVTSPSSGPLCNGSGGSCGSNVSSTYTVTVDDGGASSGSPNSVTRNFTVIRPQFLVNSSSHPVPLIFVGVNNDSFQSHLPSFRAVMVEFAPQHTNGQYATPAIARVAGLGAGDCGANGSSQCDDEPALQAILHAVNCDGTAPCQNIDTSKLYSAGSSKGGDVPEELMCDERISAHPRGVLMDSLLFPGPGPDAAAGLHCPALGQGCVWAVSCHGSTYKQISMMWLWSAQDPEWPAASGAACSVSLANNCAGQGYSTNGAWLFGTLQMATSHTSPFGAGNTTADIFGGWEGCGTRPVLNQTFGSGGTITRTYYSNCSASPHPSLTGMGAVRMDGGGHQPNGTFGLDAAQEAWNFWQKYPT